MNAVFFVNSPDYLISHRLGIAKLVQESGYNVHIISIAHESSQKIVDMGFVFHEVVMERGGTSPIKEVLAILRIHYLLKKIEPDLLHCITVKPVIYGSIIGRFQKVPRVIASIAGLGSVFTTTSFKNLILRPLLVRLYRLGLGSDNSKAIFQNREDQDYFLRNDIVDAHRSFLIKGSGVDLDKFSFKPPAKRSPKVVLFSARLIVEKGVFEFIEAAKILSNRLIDVEFWLAGDIDPGNPTSLDTSQIEALDIYENIKFLGYRKDMDRLIEASSVVVLPSYREGLPKALIEASSMGRPIVTTDVPGCRDTVIDNVTGFLVPVKSSQALADKIDLLINDSELAAAFGRSAREYAVDNFDVCDVIAKHKKIYGL